VPHHRRGKSDHKFRVAECPEVQPEPVDLVEGPHTDRPLLALTEGAAVRLRSVADRGRLEDGLADGVRTRCADSAVPNAPGARRFPVQSILPEPRQEWRHQRTAKVLGSLSEPGRPTVAIPSFLIVGPIRPLFA
jgi:hypothetical protein